MAEKKVKWYCHTCGVTHTHTPEQRDAHRDALMAAWAAQIDAVARRERPWST